MDWARETFRLQTPGQGELLCLDPGGTQVFLGVWVLCLEGESWFSEDICSESSGAGRTTLLGSCSGVLCSPPPIPYLLAFMPTSQGQEFLATKASGFSVSPRALTTSFPQPGGSLGWHVATATMGHTSPGKDSGGFECLSMPPFRQCAGRSRVCTRPQLHSAPQI